MIELIIVACIFYGLTLFILLLAILANRDYIVLRDQEPEELLSVEEGVAEGDWHLDSPRRCHCGGTVYEHAPSCSELHR